MQRLYLDANIYLDYWENRSDKMRPLGEFAFQLLRRAISCEFSIVVSDLLLIELDKVLKKEKRSDILRELEGLGKIIRVYKSDEEEEKAKEIAMRKEVPWQDVLHCLLAKRAGARYIVTRDKHFFRLTDLLQAKFPENV